MRQVFISYTDREPDNQLALQLYEQLTSQGYQVFMAAKSIKAGQKWATAIDQALNNCDHFLLLLSTRSVISEMVTEEVSTVKKRYDTTQKPQIVPIRLDLPFNHPISYDLRSYINRWQHLQWSTSDATGIASLLAELDQLFSYPPDPSTPVPSEHNSSISTELGLPANSLARPSEKLEKLPVNLAQLPLPSADPTGLISPDDPFYIERQLLIRGNKVNEIDLANRICLPGALLSIRSARQMGKTSLMTRILYQARQQGNDTVNISLQGIRETTLTNLDKLLKYICFAIEDQLDWPSQLNNPDYWHPTEDIDSKVNSTRFLSRRILSQINQHLILAIDEVDRLFPYLNQQESVANDFFSLLRDWYEKSKLTGVWRKLRIILVHSTEAYLSLPINQSPFNVGIPILLPNFTEAEVTELAHRYGVLAHNPAQIQQLMALVQGHPFLTRLALHELSQGLQFDQYLATAPTDQGLYRDHLHRIFWILEKYPDLNKAFREVLSSDQPIKIDPALAYKLTSVGLIDSNFDKAQVRLELYRQYFNSQAN